MTVETFSVVHDDVRGDYFPHWSSWSATTKPTATRVTTFISEEAADLGGRLMLKDIAPSSITLAATPNAYAWCQKTLKLMVAIRAIAVATAQNPEVRKAWEEDRDARLKQLDLHGETVLVDATSSTAGSPPEGPTSHISQYGIEVDDSADMSSTVPRLRRDDQL